MKGQLPPLGSEVVQTDWTWEGYKQVSVVDTDAPSLKYVVAHLKDRYGACDAASSLNALGISLRWAFDAGNGSIIEGQGQPALIDAGRRAASTTTFDTGNTENADITKTVVAAGECQAWIKISNSLLTPTNIRVSFPAPPSPVPGIARITGLVCSGPETIAVTNRGTSLLSLAGFSLRTRSGAYLGLFGLLAPGESITFSGGPGASILGWLNTSSEVFADADPGDYARLVWNGFEVSRMFCDKTASNPATFPPLPPDPEGEIVLDVTVQFGAQANKLMDTGWNLVTAGRGGSIASALSGNEGKVSAIYTWDPVGSRWKLFVPGGPAYLSAFDQFEPGRAYWVQVKQPFTMYVPR
jgi:hypothetical protein